LRYPLKIHACQKSSVEDNTPLCRKILRGFETVVAANNFVGWSDAGRKKTCEATNERGVAVMQDT